MNSKIKITPLARVSWADSNTGERVTLCGVHAGTIIRPSMRARYTDARQEAPDARCAACAAHAQRAVDGW
jgi:hypothetical protein